MGISPKVMIYLMTASVSLMFVTGNERGPVGITCVNTPETQAAYHGSSVTIKCKYPKAEGSIIKYFCRKDQNFNCTTLIQTYRANNTRKDRFSLTEDKQGGVYIVTISALTVDDAGRYWCAMKSYDNKSSTCFTEINLFILNWDDITPKTTTYKTGDTAHVNCSYPDSHESNEKFLCKGENPFNCKELIHTTVGDRDVVKGRFDIRDNQRRKYFYVVIMNVGPADSGTYWCGSDRTWQHAKYNKILLTVAERHTKTKKSELAPPSSQEDATPVHDILLDKGMIGGMVACLALLLLLVVVLLLIRQKLFRTQGGSSEQRTNAGHNTEGNHGDQDYEEIQMQNQQANSGHALESVYTTIKPPADQLHYASVKFQRDSVSILTDRNALPDTHENGSSACDYSSVNRTQGASLPPAAEQTLYGGTVI